MHMFLRHGTVQYGVKIISASILFKSAGYFQNFPAVDLKIESNNKRGRQVSI